MEKVDFHPRPLLLTALLVPKCIFNGNDLRRRSYCSIPWSAHHSKGYVRDHPIQQSGTACQRRVHAGPTARACLVDKCAFNWAFKFNRLSGDHDISLPVVADKHRVVLGPQGNELQVVLKLFVPAAVNAYGCSD